MNKTEHNTDESTQRIENYLETLKKSFRENCTDSRFLLELTGAIILFGYFLFTILIWCANKKAADAATNAANTAASQLELAERPWVDAIITNDNGPFIFQTNGEARFPIKIALKNSGHSPSVYTYVSEKLFIGAQTSKATDNRGSVCQEADAKVTANPPVGISLFPDRTLTLQRAAALTREDIENGKMSKEFPGQEINAIARPSLVVCIAYRPTFKSSVVYHTAYIFMMAPIDPTTGDLGTNLFEIGKSVDHVGMIFFPEGDAAITAN